MKKRILKLAGILLMIGCMAGCGSQEPEEDIALIMEPSQEGYMTGAIAEAAQQYADDNGLKIETHEVANNTADDYMVSIQEAAEGGASVIIGYGENFEEPLFTMQKKYKKIKFLILDGSPRKEQGKKSKVRKNTKAVLYNEAQAGFLAGYAAVMDGYRSLGFLGGEKQSNIAYYGSGFVQGAEYAAGELQLSPDEVTIRYDYLETNEISPSVMARASQWYEEGCELIFTSGGSIPTAVIKAAEQENGKVIASDVVQTSEKQVVVSTAVKNVNDTVYNTLGSVFGDSFEGGEEVKMDLSNDGVGLSMDRSVFQNFTADQYNAIVTKIVDGEAEVQEEYVSTVNGEEDGITHLTLNFE
ncbi:MAG: BMP family lipoprotein [Ruminococcus sp.]|jgi:basic membrane protein A